MTIGTADPTAVTVYAGTWNAFTGSTSYSMTGGSGVTAVTDSTNNTYIRTSTGGQVAYDVANPALGGSAVQRMRIGATIKNGDGNPANIFLTTTVDTSASWNGYPNTSTAQTVYTGWLARATPISSTEINAAVIEVISYSTALRFTKLWLEYDRVSTPAGTPTIAAVNTDRPTITWNFVDADGGVQASAVVKVFSAAQMAAGGFNALTSTPLWSGTVNGTAQTITPSAAIVTNNLVYRPWVQVFKNISPTVIASTISSATTTYTASWTAPAAPTLTGTYATSSARVLLTSTGQAAPYQTIIFRGTALGTALDPLFTVLKDTSTDSDGVVTVYDYYMSRGTDVVYGSYQTTGTVTPYLQSAVTYATVTVGSALNWELRSVEEPATYVNITVPVTGISFEQYEGQTVYRPIGSNYPVVVAGNIGGDDGTMTIVTTSQSKWDDIKEILDLQSNLYLVSPFPNSSGTSRRWFIRVTGRSWVESGVPAAQVRTATVSFVEVEGPEVAAD